MATQCLLWVQNVTGSVHRYAGDDRYQTSSAVSQKVWADAVADDSPRLQAKAVVLASGEGFADALAGVPLAAYKQGPLLLTEPAGLTKTTEDEIKRVLPAGATVYVLGGQAAISSAVDSQLRADGYQVTRYAGADRYGTAMRIATAGLGNPASVIVVTRTRLRRRAGRRTRRDRRHPQFQGKPAAIVLSDGPKITDAATKSFVQARLGHATGEEFGHVLALGGQAVCAVQIIDARSDSPECFDFFGDVSSGTSIGTFSTLTGDKSFEGADGGDRYETAAAVANLSEHSLPGPDGIRDNGVNFGFFGLASGTTYADALTGGAAMAVEHAPIVLTTRASFPRPPPGSSLGGPTRPRHRPRCRQPSRRTSSAVPPPSPQRFRPLSPPRSTPDTREPRRICSGGAHSRLAHLAKSAPQNEVGSGW